MPIDAIIVFQDLVKFLIFFFAEQLSAFISPDCDGRSGVIIKILKDDWMKNFPFIS